MKRKFLKRHPESQFSASAILKKLSNKETIEVNEFFKPENKQMFVKTVSVHKVRQKKKFFSDWEIFQSMKIKKDFRSRKKEVIDKVRLKPVLVEPLEIKIRSDLRVRVLASGRSLVGRRFV